MTANTDYAPTLFPTDVREANPGAARRSDNVTSHRAAGVCVIKRGSQRFLLLRAIAGEGTQGMTDEEAGTKVGIGRVADTRRCSELRKADLIRDTGRTRKLSSGCDGMISVCTKAGYDSLLAAEKR